MNIIQKNKKLQIIKKLLKDRNYPNYHNMKIFPINITKWKNGNYPIKTKNGN